MNSFQICRHGWASMLAEIVPPYVKVICPSAASIPITLDSGYRMPAWWWHFFCFLFYIINTNYFQVWYEGAQSSSKGGSGRNSACCQQSPQFNWRGVDSWNSIQASTPGWLLPGWSSSPLFILYNIPQVGWCGGPLVLAPSARQLPISNFQFDICVKNYFKMFWPGDRRKHGNGRFDVPRG